MLRYHTNSKEVLRDGKHFADCIDDGAARLIADALNERRGMPVVDTQDVLPLDGADGPLFVGDRVLPRKVNQKLMDHAREADLKLLKVAVATGDADPFEHVPDGRRYRPLSGLTCPETHHVRQENDEYACSCGKRWGVEDGEDHP